MTSRVSIALATCNGARYLPELLDSFVTQRLLPCELVASDDASNDDTTAILRDFAARAPFAVNVLGNRHRLGVVENFSRTIAACEGECIALADQDDVWRADKLEMLAAALEKPNVLAAFSDAEVVDAALTPLGYTMWQRVRFSQHEQDCMALANGFEVLLKHHVVTGATLGFRTSLRDAALPIPSGWPHDAWLALMAASHGRLVAMRETLIAYRQHACNVVGGTRKSLRSQVHESLRLDRATWYRAEIDLWHALEKRLETLSISQETRSALRDKIAHLEARAHLPAVRWLRLPGVLRELAAGRYARYARNWGSIALDLLVR